MEAKVRVQNPKTVFLFLKNTNERKIMLNKMVFSYLVLTWKIQKKVTYN